MGQGKRIGYVRVSTFDQNPERQLEGIQLDKKFVDYASAKSMDRPQLKELIEFVREDDIVIVHSMDRLARNLCDLKRLVNNFVLRKVRIEFVKEGIVFAGEDSAMSNLLLSIMGAFAEFEYAFIKERQREGIEIAKKNGKHIGPAKKLDSVKIQLLKEAMKTRRTKNEIAKELGVTRQTLYRYLDVIDKEEKK